MAERSAPAELLHATCSFSLVLQETGNNVHHHMEAFYLAVFFKLWFAWIENLQVKLILVQKEHCMVLDSYTLYTDICPAWPVDGADCGGEICLQFSDEAFSQTLDAGLVCALQQQHTISRLHLKINTI